MDNRWQKKKIADIFALLVSGENGLEAEEAKKRLAEHGPNKLPEKKSDGPFLIFLKQFQSPLIYLLFAAAIVVFAFDEAVDGYIILFVLVFNAIVGAIQEFKARNTLAALKKFTETVATVMRGGIEIAIPDYELVPGDVIVLKEGDKVPADARIILSNALRADEAVLTGESEPVRKISDPVSAAKIPADMKNMIFKGTGIAAGNGKAIVVATGTETEIGKISKKIATIDSELPLKANISHFSNLIVVFVLAMIVGLFLFGILLGEEAKVMFLTVVSLAVSVVPEGLPIVLTLVLATGVWRMSKRNALVKKLQAVESLGQARVIAVDKTGTITKNELSVARAYAGGVFFEVGGVGYEPKGEIVLAGESVDPLNHEDLVTLARLGDFCSGARTVYDEETREWKAYGDPTEAALSVFSQKIGFRREVLEREFPKIADMPFDYKLRFHASVHRDKKNKFMAVAGAPEAVLSRCSSFLVKGKTVALDEERRKKLEAIFFEMSKSGLRVIAMAIQENPADSLAPEKVSGLSFAGFVGMKDGLRAEVREAMSRAREAGIRVVMITGDHKLAAVSIARDAGIYHPNDGVLTGAEIEKFSDSELAAEVGKVSVFARFTPEHKLRIIEAFKKRGEIVAMTGDGVNDAPSLLAADLGVAMGKIGTEVAKEASDIILLDDNFGTIVSAVEEGRSIYQTIKKVILFLFSTSLGELFTIVGAMILGLPLPLLAAQIIWLNLVTDGLLDVALGMEPREEGLLKNGFRRPNKYIVDGLAARRMIIMAIPMIIGSLWLFSRYYHIDMIRAHTVCLTALAVFQWFNAWNCRHETNSVFSRGLFANKYLIAATVFSFLLQLAAIYHPFLQKILRTAPLSLSEWVMIIILSSSVVLVEESRKLLNRKLARSRA